MKKKSVKSKEKSPIINKMTIHPKVVSRKHLFPRWKDIIQ